jgi:dUTP pyrophosphatase
MCRNCPIDPISRLRRDISDMNKPTIKIQRLREHVMLPKYATKDAAGMDLFAPEDVDLMADEKKLIKLGFKMALPVGWEAQIRPRSGLALKHNITVLNSPGTIDADYRGEVGVILINFGPDHFSAKAGERIAQMVVARAPQAKILDVQALDDTIRGSGGYGSTGK